MPVIQPDQSAAPPPGSGPRIVPTAEPGARSPRVLLQLAGMGPGEEVRVTRADPDGRTRPVRAAEPVTLSATGTAQLYDYEPPFGALVRYLVSARGLRTTTVQVDPGRPYLIDPGNPARSVRLDVVNLARGTLAQRTRASSSTDIDRPNHPMPIVQTQGSRRSPAFELLLRTWTLPELAALEGLLDSGATLLLNVPPALGWGITWQYVRVGDLVEARTGTQLLQDPDRLWTLPCRVVDRPVGSLRQEWTWDTSADTYDSWDDRAAAYDSWDDLAIDRRRLTAP